MGDNMDGFYGDDGYDQAQAEQAWQDEQDAKAQWEQEQSDAGQAQAENQPPEKHVRYVILQNGNTEVTVWNNFID